LVLLAALSPRRPPSAASTDVEVVQVEQKDVPIYGEWIGTGWMVNADIKAQVSGYLLKQDTPKVLRQDGQLLFEIDPRPFSDRRSGPGTARASWRTASAGQGELVQAEAQVAVAEANQRRTQLDVTATFHSPSSRRSPSRISTTPPEQSGFKAQVQSPRQRSKPAKRRFRRQRHDSSAQAALETARLNLGFTASRRHRRHRRHRAATGRRFGQPSSVCHHGFDARPRQGLVHVSEQEYLDFNRRFRVKSPASRDGAVEIRADSG